MSEDTQGLMKLIDLLRPLSSEQRKRNIATALTFLGDADVAALERPADDGHSPNGSGAPTLPGMPARMKQYNLTSEHLEPVFDFRDDGTFSILDLPGSSIKERALNTYVVTGLGSFLATGNRQFSDEVARTNCQEHSCLDSSNHSKMLNAKHPEFTGDKNTGWSITVPGLKRAAELVKSMAEAKSK